MKKRDTVGWIALVALATLVVGSACRGDSSSPDTSPSTMDAADTAPEDGSETVDGEPTDIDGCGSDASIVCCSGPPLFVEDPICVDGEWACPETSSGRAESRSECEGPDARETMDTESADGGEDADDGASSDA